MGCKVESKVFGHLPDMNCSLDEAVVARLVEPKECIEITAMPMPINGRNLSFKAFTVRHNDVLGPTKGGIS